MRGSEEPNTTISAPSSAANETPFKERFAGVPLKAQLECWLGSFVIFFSTGDPDQYC